MNENLGIQGLPGMGPRLNQESRQFLADPLHKVEIGLRIDDVAKDLANTSTFKLRAGLVLIRVENGGANAGKYVHVGHADCPAAADVERAAILMQYVDMRDKNSDFEDKSASGLVHGFVIEDQVIFGTADATYIDAIKAALPQVMFQ